MKRRSSISKTISIPALGAHSGGLFIGVALLILLFSIALPGQVSGIRMKATDIFAPALSAIVTPVTNLADIVRNVSGIAELQAENAKLQAENIRLKEWYQTALLLQAENASLKDLLNVKIDPQYSTITARVLSDKGSAFAQSLLVAAGESDGVKKGQAVMAAQGLIGRVIETGEHSARILLMSDLNSRVPVLIEDTRQHAILAGIGGQEMHLTRLPEDTALNVNTRVTTSGHGGVYPPGLPVGRITDVGGGIQPFVNFGAITHVRILNHKQGHLIMP
ncbi:MAG: rod shape-determining protein MreC [Alphaproteobacteria bacterium]